jgi:hypothetical protein
MSLPAKYRSILNRLSPAATEHETKLAIEQVVGANEPTIYTRLNRYTQVKSYLKANRPGLVSYLVVPPSLVQECLSKSRRSLQTRETFRVEQRHIDTVLSWRDDPSFEKTCAFLEMTSGRRISEILESHFRVETRKKLSSADLKKKRGNTERHSFTLLGGVFTEEWMSRLKYLRKNRPNESVATFTRKVNMKLRRFLNHSRLSSHKLRGIYANKLHDEQGRTQIQTGFIQSVLNLDSQDCAINYSHYNIV